MKRTLALATAIWTGVAGIATAAQEPALVHNSPSFEATDSWVMAARPRKKVQPQKKAIDTTRYLTRSELAYSMKGWIGQIEGASKESWNERNGGSYTIPDVPSGNPDRVLFLTLVNGYHLWDGVPAVSQTKFNPGQAVTQSEVSQVIRNLWAYKEIRKFAKGQSVAIAFPSGLKPTDKITRQQYAVMSAPTLGMFKSTVKAGLANANLQLNKDALAAVEDREAVLLREKAASAAAVAMEARFAREALTIQEDQTAQQTRIANAAQFQSGRDALIAREALASKAVLEAQAGRNALITREALASKAVLEASAIQDAREAEVLAIKAAADSKAADEANAHLAAAQASLAAAQEKQLAEDRMLREQSSRFQGGRPLSLSLSGMPWTSMAAPESPYLGPEAKVNVALYPGPTFLTGQVKVGMFPGGPGTLMAAGGPQVPVFQIPGIAALQLQPYLGGRANFGWAGTSIDAAVGPAAGLVGRIHSGPVGLYAIAEAAFPWDGAANRLSAVPTTNLTAGVEFELNKTVSLIAGWDAQYGQASFLPYTGSLTTGVNLGF